MEPQREGQRLGGRRGEHAARYAQTPERGHSVGQIPKRHHAFVLFGHCFFCHCHFHARVARLRRQRGASIGAGAVRATQAFAEEEVDGSPDPPRPANASASAAAWRFGSATPAPTAAATVTPRRPPLRATAPSPAARGTEKRSTTNPRAHTAESRAESRAETERRHQRHQRRRRRRRRFRRIVSPGTPPGDAEAARTPRRSPLGTSPSPRGARAGQSRLLESSRARLRRVGFGTWVRPG